MDTETKAKIINQAYKVLEAVRVWTDHPNDSEKCSILRQTWRTLVDLSVDNSLDLFLKDGVKGGSNG